MSIFRAFDDILETIPLWIFFLGVCISVPYVILRIRDARHARRDPQVGMKVTLHFMVSVGQSIVWIGATFGLAELIAGTDADLDDRNAGIAMLFGGLIITTVYRLLIAFRTNDARWPIVRRTFIGFRFMMAAMISAFGLCGTLVLVLVPAAAERMEASDYIAMLAVWSVAGAIDLYCFFRVLKQPEVPGLDTRCVLCGYDLRGGGGEAVACSECGTLIAIDQRELLRPAIYAAVGAASTVS